MTSQLIDLVNTTNNIVYENLQKLNSKFKNIHKNQIINEEEEYDSLNCKISIYFNSFMEQMKTKFIIATQEYENQIQQNNKDIIDLIMENMLLKIEKDSLLEEKNKNDLYFNDYINLTIQKEKNTINTNINKNLNSIKNINSKKKCNKNNNNIYSIMKTEYNSDKNKNNYYSNNLYNNNYNLLDINKNRTQKKKKSNSCNKYNKNNYNYNFIVGSQLDLNHYYSHNKVNISYNTIGKTLYDSQDNFKLHKNKNSFSVNDFRKIKNAYSQKTKKNSQKNNRTNKKKENILNILNCNYIKKNDVQNISFRDNKIQFTEPSFNDNKKREKINFYCIKKIKEEMNEILKNRKSLNTSNNNSNNNININTSGNIRDNSSNNNKIKLPIGYNYYPKNRTNNVTNNNNKNKKAYFQNKTPKNVKGHKKDILMLEIYKDTQYKINNTISNNNLKISTGNKNQKNNGKSSIMKNNLDNNSINSNKKKPLYNNFTGFKNLKRNKSGNINTISKSNYKLISSKKNNLKNNSNKKSQKPKNIINNNNNYYNDNINNNITYNLSKKNIISRNYSNYGDNNNNYSSLYSNINYKTINNVNKMNSGNIINNEELNNNINNHNNLNLNLNDNQFSIKIRNRVNLSKNKMKNNLNKNIINNNDKNNSGNNISMNYLLNNKEIDNKKVDLKKLAYLNDENNKNETPSFYLFKKYN